MRSQIQQMILYVTCIVTSFIYTVLSTLQGHLNAQKSFLTLTAYIGSLHDLQEIYINCSIFYKTVEKTLCGGTVAKQIKRNTR